MLQIKNFHTDGVEENQGDATYYSLQRLLLETGNDFESDQILLLNRLLARYYLEDLDKDYNQLTNSKELSILTPQKLEITKEYDQDVVFMVFDNLDLYDWQTSNEQKIIDLIQLLFSLISLSDRKWNLMITEKILCQRDGRAYISLLKYTFLNYPLQDCIKQFQVIAKRMLPNLFANQTFQDYRSMAQFLIGYLQLPKVSQFDAPHLELLKKIIGTNQKWENSYYGNSYIYHIEAPQSLLLKKVSDNQNKITIKTTKIPEKNTADFNETMQNINREIETLERSRDQYWMMQCWFHIRIFDQTYICMDTCQDLSQYLNMNTLTYQQFLLITFDFARSLQMMHQQNLIHRDLKESNLFITTKDDQIRLFIGDFDRAKSSQTQFNLHLTQNNAMTEGYNAPEICVNPNNKHSQKSDVWQFGLIIYKIACRGFRINEYQFYDYVMQNPNSQDPFINLERDLGQANFKGRAIDPKLIKLIRQCLSLYEKDRPSSEEIRATLHDIYFASRGITPTSSPTKLK